MNQQHVSPRLRPRKIRDRRIFAALVAVLGTAILGYLVSLLPGRGVATEAVTFVAPAPRAKLSDLPAINEQRSADAASESLPSPPPENPAADTKQAPDPKAEETERILQAAKAQIKAKRYDAAIVMMNDARELLKADTRSYLLMANALEGKKDYGIARDFYVAAIDRDLLYADAYWGVATTSEALGELDTALGAMRSFLHVQPNADPEKLKIVQARSAIWEWESKLGRGIWGATKGIPPGFTADELRRDGRGVGIKIPIPGTEGPDGWKKYEVKHQDKFKLFKE